MKTGFKMTLSDEQVAQMCEKQMNQFDEYQKQAAKTAIYPKDRGLEYTALGLFGEVGEVANKMKKVIRDQDGVLTDKNRAEIGAEMGDVLWYIAMCAVELGTSLSALVVEDVTTWDGYGNYLSGNTSGALDLAVAVGQYINWTSDGSEEFSNGQASRVSVLRLVLVVWGEFCNTLSVRLADIAQGNLDKLASRAARNKIGGSGDER